MTRRILCYGDSNTWGYRPIAGTRYDSETRWPARLGKLTGFEVAEEGLNGRTTMFYDADELYRCGLDYVETCVMSQLPLDLIIVMLGSNDTKIQYHASPEETADGLSRMIDKMRECCARKEQDPQILILSPPKLFSGYKGTDPEISEEPCAGSEESERPDSEKHDPGNVDLNRNVSANLPSGYAESDRNVSEQHCIEKDEVEFDFSSEQKILKMEVLFEKLAEEKGCRFLRTSDVVTDIGADGLHMTPEGHRKLAEAVAEIACRILRK